MDRKRVSTSGKNPMSQKLEVIKQKWSNINTGSNRSRETIVRTRENSMKLQNTVSFLMGVQFPAMLNQITSKDAEIHQLQMNNSDLSAKVSSALKKISVLQEFIAAKNKKIEQLEGNNSPQMESKIALKSEIREKHREIDALKEENMRLNVELQSSNEKLQHLESLRADQLHIDDQWTRIAEEMAQIHNVQQYVYFE